MTQYEIPFKSIDGRDCLVEVSLPNYSVIPIRLTGTDNPFTTSLDDSDDLFSPVRRSTGYIRILDTGTCPDIIPTSPKLRGVRLTVDGTLMWQGWLRPESYKSSWDTMHVLEIPIQSGLGVLDTLELPQEDITLRNGTVLPVTYGTVRIARLILECVHLMGTTVNTIVFPATITSTDGWGALGYRLSRWNYFERNTDTNYDDEDWKPLESKTAYEVLSDICTFLGWTCQEWHSALYFVEVGATDYAAVTYEQLISYATEVSTPEVSSVILPLPLSLSSDYKLAGSRNTIEHMQPARKVTMSVSSSEVSDLLGIREQDLELFRYRYDNSALYEEALKAYISKTPLIELHKYIYTGSVWEEIDITDMRTFDGVGGFVAGYDFVPIDMDNRPRNFDLSTGIYLEKKAKNGSTWVAPTSTQALDMPAIVIKSPGAASFSAGYLCISATAQSCKRDGGGGTHSGAGMVKAQLKIGDKYWDGTNHVWTTTPSYFNIAIVSTDDDDPTKADGDGKVVDQKYLNIDCESCSGQLIAISGAMEGDVVLTIPTLVQTVSGNSGNYDELFLRDFRIEYKAPVSNYYEEGDTRHYTAFTGSDGEAVKVKASIASNNNTRPGYGLLMTASNVPVKTVTYTDNEQTRPELRLINRMASHYSTVRDKITVDVDPYQADGASVPNTDNPLTLVGYGSKTFAIIGREVNWRDWTQTLTLLEI